MKKSAINESQLRKLIKKIIQEELITEEEHHVAERLPPTQQDLGPGPRPGFDGFRPDPGFEGFAPGGFEGFGPMPRGRFDHFQPPHQQSHPPEMPHTPQSSDRQGEEPWAFFGAPEPAPTPMRTRRLKEERPRALPGWSEPYRPNYNEIESPRSAPRRRKR